MRYVMLIHNDPGSTAGWEALSPEEKGADIARHRAWFGRYASEGRIVGGEELAPASSGRIVRRRADSVSVTDGPFAETREVLGGFIVSRRRT